MNPGVWPYMVGVRRFIPKRPKNDWAAQSAQSGGNIHTEQREHNSRSRDGGAHHGGGVQRGQQHHSRYNRGDQYAPNAPSIDQFQLQTQNRFNGLQDNAMN